jgi:hypothetical protein
LLAVTGGHGWWHFGKSDDGGHHQQAQQQQKQNLPEGVQATDLRMPGVSPQQVGRELICISICEKQNSTFRKE